MDDMDATVVDRIVIAVPDLASALAEYECVFAVAPVEITDPAGGHRAWLALANTVIELREQVVPEPLLQGLVFSSMGEGQTERPIENSMALALSLCDGQASREFRAQFGQVPADRLIVDHIVLRTADADACLSLFGETLGIRLALDKNAPEWGGRMLFFRTGKLTLEVIEAVDHKPESDFFWGIAFQCQDIEHTIDRLSQRGVSVSDLRDGRKPGTRVVTIKSHNLGIPTLLIEPAAVK